MKLSIHSDLHLEFSDVEISSVGADVLILSGDILLAGCLADFPHDYDNTIIVSKRQVQAIRFRDFLRYCSEDFKHVIYVAGNHEFYHYRWHNTLNVLRDECDRYSNVHFLENNTFELDDVLFVGATLWSDFNKSDPLSMLTCAGPTGLNDFQIIKNESRAFKKIKPDDVIQRHCRTLDYFDTVISNASPTKKIVVVGHHAPTMNSISEEYKDDIYMNGAYASDLSNFILNHQNICLWTHGHVHTAFDYYIGNTRVVCNPRGYVSANYAEVTNWNPNLIIEV